MAEYAYLSDPDPEFAPLLDTLLSYPPIYDVAKRRARFNQVFTEAGKKTYGPRVPDASAFVIQDHTVEVDGGSIQVRSVVPAEEGTFPLFVWTHGGGWVCGDLEADDMPVRIIAHEFKFATINIDYRLCPEHRHPTQLNDCLAAIKWAVSNTALLRADLKKGFILAGLSAGAHLTAVLSHRIRDDPFFVDKPTGHVLQFPAVVHPDVVPEENKDRMLSFKQNHRGPILSADSIVWLWHQFLDDTDVDPADPDVSPLLAKHEGLPPTIIQVAGLDPLRDEGLLYNDVLKKAGVKTRLSVYPGLPHAFNYAFGHYKAGIRYEEEYHAGLRWLQAGAPDAE